MTKPTTHCQVCGRAILANTGTIAHHGYQRPGNGWQTASCYGAKHVPYEVGHDALDRWIVDLNNFIPRAEKQLADYLTNPPETVTVHRYMYGATSRNRVERPGYPKQITKPAGFRFNTDRPSCMPDAYDTAVYSHANSIKRNIREMRETLVYATERRAAWVAPAIAA